MPNDTITIKVLGIDLASTPFGKVVGSMDAMAKKGGLVGSVFQGVGQSFGQMLNPIGLVSQGIGQVVGFLEDSVAAATAEETNIAHLTEALQANIPAWNGNTDAIEEVIKAREKLAFDDAAQRDSLAQLVARTHDVNKALDLEREAMDLARFKKIDLTSATEILGKVYSGNVAILKRYGIAVRDGATAEEALAAIQQQSAGQAQAYADKTQGAMESMQIAFQDAQEEIGTKLLPILKELAVYVRDDLVPGLLSAVDAIGQVGTAVNDLSRTMSPGVAATQDLHAELEGVRKAALEAGLTTQQMDQFLKDNNVTTITSIEQADALGNALLKLAEAKKNDARESTIFANQQARVAESLNDMSGPAAAYRIAMQRAGQQTIRTKNSITASLMAMDGSVHSNLDDMTNTARSSMADLMWAIRNPNAWKKTRAELQKDMRQATKALATAQRQGRPEVVAQAQKTIDLIQAQLNQLPGTSNAVVNAVNADLRGIVIDAQAARAAILGIPSLGGEHHGGRARGGPVLPGGVYTVGESGRETLVMGRSGGMVIPGGGRSGGGSGVNVHVHFHNLAPPSPTEGQRIAQSIAPHLVREMRRTGALA